MSISPVTVFNTNYSSVSKNTPKNNIPFRGNENEPKEPKKRSRVGLFSAIAISLAVFAAVVFSKRASNARKVISNEAPNNIKQTGDKLADIIDNYTKSTTETLQAKMDNFERNYQKMDDSINKSVKDFNKKVKKSFDPGIEDAVIVE